MSIAYPLRVDECDQKHVILDANDRIIVDYDVGCVGTREYRDYLQKLVTGANQLARAEELIGVAIDCPDFIDRVRKLAADEIKGDGMEIANG